MVNLGGLDEEVSQEIRDEEQEGKITALVEKKPKRRPFHYWKVGNREYKLKLITGMIEKLENKYRQNILNLVAVDGIPPLSTMLTVIQAAIYPWEHGISYNDIKAMYDRWVEEGGNQMEFYTNVLMPTLAVSGFFTQQQAESMMESLENMDELL